MFYWMFKVTQALFPCLLIKLNPAMWRKTKTFRIASAFLFKSLAWLAGRKRNHSELLLDFILNREAPLLFFLPRSSAQKKWSLTSSGPRRGVGNGKTQECCWTGSMSALDVVASSHLLCHLCPGTFYDRSAYRKGRFARNLMNATHSCPLKDKDVIIFYSSSLWPSSQGFRFWEMFIVEISGN